MTSTRGTGGYLAGSVHAVRHRWALVLCAALAVTLDALRGLRYTAESLVRVQDLGEAGVDGGSEERLAEIRTAVGAEEVARGAIREIGWERDIQEFDQRLDVETAGDGRRSVEFSANDPERAAEGANAYASSFVARVEGLAGDRLAGDALNADAEVARRAQPPPAPSRARLVLVGLAALVSGVAAGGALALALGGRDRRLRDTRDAELTLGAPVLGVIPDYGAGEQGGRRCRQAVSGDRRRLRTETLRYWIRQDMERTIGSSLETCALWTGLRGAW